MHRVILAILLAGCLSGPGADSEPENGSEDMPGEPTWSTWNLTADGRLVTTAVDAALVPLEWGDPDYLQDNPPPKWVADSEGMRIMEARAVLEYSGTVAVENPTRAGPYTAWWGVGDSILGHPTPDVSGVPDASQTVTFPLEIPRGGAVVTSDLPLTLHVGRYGVGDLDLVLGESRIEVLSKPWHEPTFVTEEHTTISGALPACSGGVWSVSEHTYEPIGNYTEVRLTSTRLAGYPDIDLFIEDRDGAITRAHGPGSSENLYVFPVNHAPGPWTIRALGFCSSGIEYDIQFLAGSPTI